MFNFNNMVTKVPQPTKQQIYVGAPNEGKAFTVHPTDQTDPDVRVNLYYDSDSKRMHIFDITNFPDIEGLYKKKLKWLTSSVLHRAIYADGTEFIMPVHDYAVNTRWCLKEFVEQGQQGNWLVRYENQYDIDNSPHQANWSHATFNELLEKAFEHYVIDSLDHPVVKNFRFL